MHLKPNRLVFNTTRHKSAYWVAIVQQSEICPSPGDSLDSTCRIIHKEGGKNGVGWCLWLLGLFLPQTVKLSMTSDFLFLKLCKIQWVSSFFFFSSLRLRRWGLHLPSHLALMKCHFLDPGAFGFFCFSLFIWAALWFVDKIQKFRLYKLTHAYFENLNASANTRKCLGDGKSVSQGTKKARNWNRVTKN